MPLPPIDFADVQGLVRYGYGALTEACFFLLRVVDSAPARAWLATASSMVTPAIAADTAPDTALQIALSCDGLRALGVAEDIIGGFSSEFIAGMAGEDSRSRRLGDLGASSPTGWRWGAPGHVPHVLVMLYGRGGQLEQHKAKVQAGRFGAAFEVLDCLTATNMDGVEPFGFADGISQPVPDWDRARAPVGTQIDYGNLVMIGEFLLGYPNEYGKYTDRPLIKPARDSRDELFAAEDQPGKRDLARNGSYLVFRQLRQDVRGFWQFLRTQEKDAARRQALAESMVGRRMSGEPLEPRSTRRIDGVGPDADDLRLNQFTYESDPDGLRCPFGAHVRRTNPRNPDFPYGTYGIFRRLVRVLGFGRRTFRDELIASTRFHRILRRGRAYGSKLSPEQALGDAPPNDPETGLYFICLAGNISRQFEFVQNAWVMGSKFNGLTRESDPLLSNRLPTAGAYPTDTYSIPRLKGSPQRVNGIPQFVTVVGGAYFFLPSIRALRFIGGG